MYEYSSVSASSYDPGALVAKLNEAAADGWDVVSIVPTGGDVSAFLRRDLDAELDEAIAEEVALEDAIAEEEAIGRPRRSSPPRTALVAEEMRKRPSSRKRPRARSRKRPRRRRQASRPSPTMQLRWRPAPGPPTVPRAHRPSRPAWSRSPRWPRSPSRSRSPPAGRRRPPPRTRALRRRLRLPRRTRRPLRSHPRSGANRAEPVPAPPAAAPEPAPVVTTPAGWYPDPAGRARAALLGQHAVDRARGPAGPAVHGPARPLSLRPDPAGIDVPGCRTSEVAPGLIARQPRRHAPRRSVTPASSAETVRAAPSSATRGSSRPSSARGSPSAQRPALGPRA